MHLSHQLLGAPAPDFLLKNEKNQPIRLKEIFKKQPTVLIFYPGDLTPGCTLQLCAIRDDWAKFRSAGIAVFGINHANAESHAAFSKKHAFPFPLLIDPQKKVSKLYQATRSLFGAPLIRRTVVGIDTQGIIRYLKHGMPKDADILKAMQAYSIKHEP